VSPRVKPKRTADDVLDLAANRLARGELAEARLERLLLQANRGRSELAEFRSRVVSGERTHAASRDEVWWKYLLTPAVPSALGGSVYGLDREEHRVLSKASSAAGGYLVPTDMDAEITAARRARAVIGALARELVTSEGAPLLMPTTTTHGVATWTAENVAYTASDEVFGQVTLNAFKAAVQVIWSEELARDAAAPFEAHLADELGQRIAMLEETAFAVGDGSGKPLGVTTGGNGVSTVTAATGSSTGFKLADVNAVWAALPDAYKPTASWIMSPSAFRSLAVLVDTAGGLVLPTLHTAEPTLFSRPVYQSADLPAAAANARSVVVGDFSLGYLVRRVRGVAVQRQEELFSNLGQVGLRAFERLDGRIIVADALRILVNSAT
jgi:HK97 family phage major capsid protein